MRELAEGRATKIHVVYWFTKTEPPKVDAEFDPATISTLEDAFEVAWTRVRASKAPYGSDEYAPAGRAIIATHIISAAKAGERDPRWLADSAILYLSEQKLSRNPPNVLPSIGS